MSPLTTVDDLGRSEAGIVLLDARAGAGAEDRYREQHLRGARFVDLEHDLAATKPDPSNGGRHPLPTLEHWCSTVGDLGIAPGTRVVLYDDLGGALAAARAWWMLKAIGHEHVSLLDGGLQAALDAGYPASSGDQPTAAGFQPYPRPRAGRWRSPISSIEDIEELRFDGRRRLLDVRAASRYRGEEESLDPAAGHIPGAVSLPYSSNLDEDGRFLAPHELAQHFAEAIGDLGAAATTVYCGSGVTACHTLFAMQLAGLEGASLYVGSWSQWCRRDRPRAIVT